MKYLFGDSTDSGLEVNYLAFVRDVIDCSVVLVENELTLASTIEQRRAREKATAAVLASVEELGKSAAQLLQPVVKEHGEAPVGRVASGIVAAAKQAVERESLQVRAALTAELAQLDHKDRQLRERCHEVLDKLLRTHDLPNHESSFEINWSNGTGKATLRQSTKFGVTAVIGIEIPTTSVLCAPDLRVDRLAEGIELFTVEAGGWLKKSDKLVPQKLGRYHIVRVLVDKDVSVRLRTSLDPSAAGFDVTMARDGYISIERTASEPGREHSIDEERSRVGLKLLCDRIDAAVQALSTLRSGLVSLHVDGTALAALPHPRILAERLILAIAPVVQQIAAHSRSPGELVLRVPVGNNRREELFVSTADLIKRYQSLPASGWQVFAPLQLGAEPEVTNAVTPSSVSPAAGEAIETLEVSIAVSDSVVSDGAGSEVTASEVTASEVAAPDAAATAPDIAASEVVGGETAASLDATGLGGDTEIPSLAPVRRTGTTAPQVLPDRRPRAPSAIPVIEAAAAKSGSTRSSVPVAAIRGPASQTGPLVPMPDRSRPSPTGQTFARHSAELISTAPDKGATKAPERKESLVAKPEVLSASIDAAFVETDDDKTAVRIEPLP